MGTKTLVIAGYALARSRDIGQAVTDIDGGNAMMRAVDHAKPQTLCLPAKTFFPVFQQPPTVAIPIFEITSRIAAKTSFRKVDDIRLHLLPLLHQLGHVLQVTVNVSAYRELCCCNPQYFHLFPIA